MVNVLAVAFSLCHKDQFKLCWLKMDVRAERQQKWFLYVVLKACTILRTSDHMLANTKHSIQKQKCTPIRSAFTGLKFCCNCFSNLLYGFCLSVDTFWNKFKLNLQLRKYVRNSIRVDEFRMCLWWCTLIFEIHFNINTTRMYFPHDYAKFGLLKNKGKSLFNILCSLFFIRISFLIDLNFLKYF